MRNRKLRVAVDIDGVLYDFISEMCFLLREHRGMNIRREDITTWQTADKIGEKDWKWLWQQRELFQDGNLVSGAKRGYELLKKIADAPIVTSRPERVIADTYLWLALHRFPCQELHILGGDQRKSEVPWDVIIDDKDEHILDAVAAGRRAIVFTQQWNLQLEPLAGVKRADNWTEVLDRVNEHAYELSIEEAKREQS